MKQIYLTLILSVFGFLLMAQEPTNPAAKSYYKSLKKQLEKIGTMEAGTKLYEREINSAEEKINYIEKYEPGFTFDLEKQSFAKYKKKHDEITTKAIAASSDAFSLGKELEEIFKSAYTFDLGKENSKQYYEGYKTKVEKFLADGGKKRYDDARSNGFDDPDNLKKEVSFDNVLSDIEKSLKESGGVEQAMVYFYRCKVYQVYWGLASQLDPTNVQYAENLKKINALAPKLGSEESIKTTIEKKAKERADKKQMPAAVRKDPDLESKIKQSFMAMSKERGWNIEITKVNIITKDWIIIRDKYTNVIVKRSQSASVAAKKDGKCIVYDFVNYYQQYDGSKYLSGECGNDYQWPEEINCNNLK